MRREGARGARGEGSEGIEKREQTAMVWNFKKHASSG